MSDSENEVRDFIRRKSASDDQQEWAIRRLEAALSAAREEGRREGFEKAREMAAALAEESTGLLPTAPRKRLASDIRRMVDGDGLEEQVRDVAAFRTALAGHSCGNCRGATGGCQLCRDAASDIRAVRDGAGGEGCRTDAEMVALYGAACSRCGHGKGLHVTDGCNACCTCRVFAP